MSYVALVAEHRVQPGCIISHQPSTISRPSVIGHQSSSSCQPTVISHQSSVIRSSVIGDPVIGHQSSVIGHPVIGHRSLVISHPSHQPASGHQSSSPWSSGVVIGHQPSPMMHRSSVIQQAVMSDSGIIPTRQARGVKGWYRY
jgi:hypothetical protein